MVLQIYHFDWEQHWVRGEHQNSLTAFGDASSLSWEDFWRNLERWYQSPLRYFISKKRTVGREMQLHLTGHSAFL